MWQHFSYRWHRDSTMNLNHLCESGFSFLMRTTTKIRCQLYYMFIFWSFYSCIYLDTFSNHSVKFINLAVVLDSLNDFKYSCYTQVSPRLTPVTSPAFRTTTQIRGHRTDDKTPFPCCRGSFLFISVGLHHVCLVVFYEFGSSCWASVMRVNVIWSLSDSVTSEGSSLITDFSFKEINRFCK